MEPDDLRPDMKNATSSNTGPGFPTSFGPAQKTLSSAAGPDADAGREGGQCIREAGLVYTVLTNATLMGSIAMTALIGRVPIDGTVIHTLSKC